jgi:outer membrane receptor protein involved in Fe transport
VTVTLIGAHRGERVVTHTDPHGRYRIERILPGHYRLEAELAGFRSLAVPSVRVAVDDRVSLDLRLDVGPRTESVTVSPPGQLLETDSAAVASRLDAVEIAALPNLERNFTRFLLFTPGTQLQGWQHAASENPQGSVQTMVNGRPFSSTGYQLDGVDNRENILGLVVINPTLESIAETKVTSQNFPAEFGQATAGIVSVQTRSGTNAWHGSVFGFLADDRFQARNPFTQPPDEPLPDARRHLFGASVGGPLVRDRWFAFADYQGTRSTTGRSRLLTVPTMRARGGDFSEYGIDIYDPAGGPPAARLPFPGNALPRHRFSEPAWRLMLALPVPNRPGIENNYAVSGSETFDVDQLNLRVDGTPWRTVTTFARYTVADADRAGPPSFGEMGGPEIVSLGGTSQSLNHNLAAGLDWSIGSSTLLSARLGFFRYQVDVLQFDFGRNGADDFGLAGLNLGLDSSGLPAFRLEGPYGLVFGSGSASGCNCPLFQDEKQAQLGVHLSRFAGAHSLKAGVEVRRATNRRAPSDANRSGEFTFSEATTRGPSGGGLGIASFLLGEVSTFRRYAAAPGQAVVRQWREAAFAQDTWRVSPSLTLELGLRVDVVNPQTVAPGQGGWVDLATGEIVVGGVGGNGADGGVRNALHWGPRLGVAWRLGPRTVLRAGYGRGYDVGVDGSNFGVTPTQNPPVLVAQDLNPAQDHQRVLRLGQAPPPPVFPAPDARGRIRLPDGVLVRALPDTVRLPGVDAYNVALQRELDDATTIELAYVGNRGFRGYAGGDPTINLNQPILDGFPEVPTDQRRPFFAGPVSGVGGAFGWTQAILYYCACADTRYDSLQARLVRRTRRGLSLQAHYVLQRAQESGRNYFVHDPDLNRGRPEWDRTHAFVATTVAELPLGRGRRLWGGMPRPLDALLGGWRAGAYAVVQSGLPFAATYRDAGADRDTGPDRPDRIGDAAVGQGDGLSSPWFNVTPIGSPGSAFGRPAIGTFGSLPPDAFTGPAYWRVDASLSKSFRLPAQATVEVRVDVVNLFNHVNLGLPDAEIGVPGSLNPGAGFITSTAYSDTDPQRNLQFGLRLSF